LKFVCLGSSGAFAVVSRSSSICTQWKLGDKDGSVVSFGFHGSASARVFPWPWRHPPMRMTVQLWSWSPAMPWSPSTIGRLHPDLIWLWICDYYIDSVYKFTKILVSCVYNLPNR
jgi:hypothetical protein